MISPWRTEVSRHTASSTWPARALTTAWLTKTNKKKNLDLNMTCTAVLGRTTATGGCFHNFTTGQDSMYGALTTQYTEQAGTVSLSLSLVFPSCL